MASTDGVPNALDLFSTLPTQIAIEEGFDDIIYPKTGIEDGNPIEFNIKPSYNCAIDPKELYLCFTCSLVDEQGRKIPKQYPHMIGGDSSTSGTTPPTTSSRGEQRSGPLNPSSFVIPVNGLLSSMIEDVTVKMHGTVISGGENTYAHKADLENRLSYPKESKEGSLTLINYNEEKIPFEDLTRDQIEEIFKEGEKIKNNKNSLLYPFFDRAEHVFEGDNFTMRGKLHTEIVDQNKFLPAGKGIEIKIELKKGKFYLMTVHGERINPRLKIHKAYMQVRNAQLSPEILLEQTKDLERFGNYIIPIRRTVLKSFSIGGPTTKDISVNELSTGYLPRRVIVGLLKNSAYNGDYGLDPFNYQHFNIESVELKVDGRSKPYTGAIEVCFDKQRSEDYTMGYFTLLRASYSLFNVKDIGLRLKDYMQRNVLFGFDLTPSLTAAGQSFEKLKPGVVSLHIRLSEGATEALTVVAYCEYDSQISIDRYNNVSLLHLSPYTADVKVIGNA